MHYGQRNRKAAFESGLEMSARVYPGLTDFLAHTSPRQGSEGPRLSHGRCRGLRERAPAVMC